MPEFLLRVQRTVTLAIEAPDLAAAEDAAFSEAWSWAPENAAGCDQGMTTVEAVSRGA